MVAAVPWVVEPTVPALVSTVPAVVAVSQNKKSEFHAHGPTQREESMIIQHCCGVVLPVTVGAVVTSPGVVAEEFQLTYMTERGRRTRR